MGIKYPPGVQKWSQNPISPLYEAGFRIYLKDDLRGSKGRMAAQFRLAEHL
jgi:hypothetical protein